MYREPKPDPKPEPLSKLEKIQAKKEKQESWKYLEKKADDLFSKLIRLRDSDQYGRVRCITCKHVGTIASMQCGHFVSRGKYSTRWEWFNAAAQCGYCNGPNHGRQHEFGIQLDIRYGAGTSTKMWIKSRNVFKKNTEILKIIISDLERKLEELQKIKNN